jgi:serine/threonine protein kinase
MRDSSLSGTPEPNPDRGSSAQRKPDPADLSTLETVVSVSRVSSSVDSHAQNALGRRYEILGEAGRGAMGQVFKARDRETGEIVALKILKPEIASDPAMVERFKSELLFARKITHKNVCRVYEFNRVDGVAFTSMEFVEGESLRSVLKRFGNLTQRKGTHIALQMCSGLKEAHAQGIVHRDLKPENVMIDTQGNVKIMDFGIARSMEALTLTTGALVGTPAYMAPEQAAGKSVDHRADIYSLGLMLYEMFSGAQAFRGDNAIAVALKHINESPKPPREIEPSISPAMERVILRCLEKEPDERFQSIAELESELDRPNVIGASTAEAFTGVAAPKIPAAANSAPATPPVQWSSRSKGWIAAGGLLVLAVVALGAGLARHRSNGSKDAIDDQHMEIHSPNGSITITPDAVSIEKGEPLKAAEASPKPAPKVVIHKGNESVAMELSNKSASAEHAPVAPQQPQTPPVAASPSLPGMQANSATVQNSDANSAAAKPQDLSASDDVVPEPPSAAGKNGGGYVWVNRFPHQIGAQNAAKKIESMGLPVTVMPRRHPDNTDFFVVLTGPYSVEKIDGVIAQLEANGFAFARRNHPTAGAHRNPSAGQTPASAP